MLTTTPNYKIQSQKTLISHDKPHHHQELVFQDFKIIFYDDQLTGLTSQAHKKYEKKNTFTHVNNLGKASLENFKNKYSRLQAMSAKTKVGSRKIKKPQISKQNNEDKQNITINLVPSTSIRNFQKKSSILNDQICPKSAQRMSGYIPKPRTSRVQQNNNQEGALTKLLSPRNSNLHRLSSSRNSKIFAQKSGFASKTAIPQKSAIGEKQSRKASRIVDKKLHRASSINNILKPSNTNVNKNQKQNGNKSKLYKKKTNNKEEGDKSNIFDKAQNMDENQSQYQDIGMSGHEDVKVLFGGCHQLMKCNRDYLISKHWEHKSQPEVIKVKKFRKNLQSQNDQKGGTQKRLQDQLQVLNNIPQSDCLSPTKSMNKNYQTTSSFLAPQSLPLLQRAAILPYLKKSQTKKLLSIIIQPQMKIYVDTEFNHSSTQKIGGQEVEWLYIEPNENVILFGNNDKLQQNDRKQSKIATFLRCVYQVQPQLIKRLFQPVIRNVFSVWLYVDGSFEPVFVDGYFPLDTQLDHFYGGSRDQLWIPVLIKCICKIKNTFQQQTLQKIDADQIYHMLTGAKLQKIPQQKFCHSPPSQISTIIQNHLEQNSQCIAYESPNYYAVQQSEGELIFYSPQTHNYKSISSIKRHKLQIYVLPSFFNYFVYDLQVQEKSLSKFQIGCSSNVEIIFTSDLRNRKSNEISSQGEEKREGRRVYIYESVGIKSSGKVKLVLRMENEICDSLKCKLRRGNYKIFIEDGQRKIQTLFSDNNVVKWHQKYIDKTHFRLSLLASHQIKLSQIQALYKKGLNIEDSLNIYKNPSPNHLTKQ